ncbi:DUF4124 domain-containing protein [Massilia jejuensis]|uniref:DUF4124 domain-containing protein n=1 Tax=Massilia jejuensis TaxID=648894 RepID=A0ABW0PIA8_9BURK
MPSSLRPRLLRLAPLLPLLLCCAGAAQAQYVWIAPNGVRQYSDQPPPPGTPPSKILKARGRPAPVQDIPAARAPAGTAKPTAPTLAEREADYRKRAREREEAARKAENESAQAAARRESCESQRRRKRVLDSGIRIGDIDDKGEKRYLSDSERAARTAAVDKALADCR